MQRQRDDARHPAGMAVRRVRRELPVRASRPFTKAACATRTQCSRRSSTLYHDFWTQVPEVAALGDAVGLRYLRPPGLHRAAARRDALDARADDRPVQAASAASWTPSTRSSIGSQSPRVRSYMTCRAVISAQDGLRTHARRTSGTVATRSGGAHSSSSGSRRLLACADRVRPARTVSSIAASLLAACASHRPSNPGRSSAPPVVLVAARGRRRARPARQPTGPRRAARLPRAARPATTCCSGCPARAMRRSRRRRRPDLPQRYRIVFVPGLFSECFDRYARPFVDVAARAAPPKASPSTTSGVPGRGTSAANAARLADHFAAVADDPRPIIVFAYSKGLPDTLEFVVRHPKAARAIAAIVSVAGAANGSPLADDLYAAYRRLGRRLSAAGLRRRYRATRSTTCDATCGSNGGA